MEICDEVPCNPAATGAVVNTLTTTTATALNISNTLIGSNRLELRSVTSNGGANGIVLNGTGSSGGLTISGTGTPGSGGTIQNKAIGISLTSTQSPSLAWMQLNGFSDFAIRGSAVVGFSLANSVINGASGDNAAADEGAVSFSELTGSASISNTRISGGYEDNLRVVNTTGTLNRLTIDAVDIGSNHVGASPDGSQDAGNDGIFLEALGSAVLNATVSNSDFTAARGDLFQFANNGTAANDLVFTGNALSNSYPRIATGGGGVSIFSNGTGNLSLTLTDNTFRDAVGTALLLVKSTGTASFTGTLSNNEIGASGVANSGSLEGSALKLQNAGQGTMTLLVQGNVIRQYNNFGIELLTGGGSTAYSGALNATITGNTIAEPGNNPATAAIAKNGVHLNAGTVPGDTYQVCLDLGGAGGLQNSLASSGAPNDSFAGGEDIRLRQRQDTIVQLRGYTGARSDITAVQNYLVPRNSGDGAPSTIASSNAVQPTAGYFNTPGPGAACPQP